MHVKNTFPSTSRTDFHLSTGSTGYIGGSVLEGVLQAYPNLEIIALLRSPSDGFASRSPQIRIILGDFDTYEVIEQAAHEAEIVIRKIALTSHQRYVCNTRESQLRGDF